jgi:uncharacterized protein
MNVVLDTNVLVSGLLNPYGAPGRIVELVASGELSLRFDTRILGEYREVLLRPAFSFRVEQIESLLEQIRSAGALVATVPLPHRLPDHDDEPFLEVAMAAGADCLVTGNLRHYPARSCGPIRIVSPAKLLEILRTI